MAPTAAVDTRTGSEVWEKKRKGKGREKERRAGDE
jgi:hypothetical protein